MKDYKQKLKEALDDKLVPVEVQEWIEDNFPELVESEDERIRKAISQCVEDMRGQFEKLYRVHHKDAIAWLKKQGEQKHTAEEVLIKAGLKPYKDGDQWCVLLGDNIQEGICGFGNTIEDALYAFLKDLIASQGEQKHRVQPNIELTLLDKNILEAAIAFVEQNDHFNYWSGVDKHTVLSALHSLKYQNTWKPSEEMLEALYRSIPENVMEKSENEILLDKLYQGLKYGRVLSKK